MSQPVSDQQTLVYKEAVSAEPGVLPEEILDRIFFSLQPQDLQAAGLVCRQWYRLSKDERHWKVICEEKGLGKKPDEMSWFEYAKSQAGLYASFEKGEVMGRQPVVSSVSNPHELEAIQRQMLQIGTFPVSLTPGQRKITCQNDQWSISSSGYLNLNATVTFDMQLQPVDNSKEAINFETGQVLGLAVQRNILAAFVCHYHQFYVQLIDLEKIQRSDEFADHTHTKQIGLHTQKEWISNHRIEVKYLSADLGDGGNTGDLFATCEWIGETFYFYVEDKMHRDFKRLIKCNFSKERPFDTVREQPKQKTRCTIS